MKSLKLCLFFVLLITTCCNIAAGQLEVKIDRLKTLSGDEFLKTTVTKLDDKKAKVEHNFGVSKIDWTDLPEHIRVKFGMGKQEVAAKQKAELERLENLASELKKKADAVKAKIEAYSGKYRGKLTFEQLGLLTSAEMKNILTYNIKFSNTKNEDTYASIIILRALLGNPDFTDFSNPKGDIKISWQNGIYNPLTEKNESVELALDSFGNSFITSRSGENIDLPKCPAIEAWRLGE